MAQDHHLFYMRELDIHPVDEQISVNIFDEQAVVTLVLIMAVNVWMLQLAAKYGPPSVEKISTGVVGPDVLKFYKFSDPWQQGRMKRFKHKAVLFTAVDQVGNPGGAASAIADNPNNLFWIVTFGGQVEIHVKFQIIKLFYQAFS